MEPEKKEKSKLSFLTSLLGLLGRGLKTVFNILASRPFLLVLVLALAVGLGFFYQEYQKTKKKAEIPLPARMEEARKQEVKMVLDQLKKRILVPDEEPMIATIIDVELLKKQSPFYEKAKAGDRLIVYQDRAIIFDLEKGLIVNIAPIQLTPAPTPKPVSVDIYNGTSVSGLSRVGEEKVKALGVYEIKVRGNANKKDYKKTVVYRAKGEEFMARGLAERLGAEFAGNLPGDERPSEADVVVIVGEEWQEK